jgi:hypothetical protein
MRLIPTLAMCTAPLLLSAQLTVTDSLDQAALTTLLEGLNVTISNLQINCPGAAYGEFNGYSEIPIAHGLVMSCGLAETIAGVNTFNGTSFALNVPGDADLDALIFPATTNDACVLEFDCLPSGDSLVFNFSFGSEEYPEFVGAYNDAFAVWLSGPGLVDTMNVATIPGGIPVSIDNVNDTTNSAYYMANDSGQYCTMDGFTQNLQGFAVVQPGDTYHFKIAIADALDMVFDSAVLLEAFSFRSFQTFTGVRDIAPVHALTAYLEGNTLTILGSATNGSAIAILDAHGRCVQRATSHTGAATIDVSSLSPGAYAVVLAGSQGDQVVRFAKP